MYFVMGETFDISKSPTALRFETLCNSNYQLNFGEMFVLPSEYFGNWCVWRQTSNTNFTEKEIGLINSCVSELWKLFVSSDKNLVGTDFHKLFVKPLLILKEKRAVDTNNYGIRTVDFLKAYDSAYLMMHRMSREKPGLHFDTLAENVFKVRVKLWERYRDINWRRSVNSEGSV